jgi:hypothetical protein
VAVPGAEAIASMAVMPLRRMKLKMTSMTQRRTTMMKTKTPTTTPPFYPSSPPHILTPYLSFS